MARKAKASAPRPLNARQAEFVRHYTAGADGVRGNATQAFLAAGYSPKGADKMASRLLGNAVVADAIATVHAKADEAATNKLRDWKEMAPAAQARIELIGQRMLPGADEEPPVTFCDRDGAAVAKVVLDANREILERAYPKKLQVEHSGEVKGGVLAVPLPVAQQDWDAMAKAQQERLGHAATSGD